MSWPRVTRECSDWLTKLRRCTVSDITCGPLAAALKGTAACPSRSAAGSQINTDRKLGPAVSVLAKRLRHCGALPVCTVGSVWQQLGFLVLGALTSREVEVGVVPGYRFTSRRNVTGSWWRHQANCCLLGRSPPGSPPCLAPGMDSRPQAGSLAGPRCARRWRRRL